MNGVHLFRLQVVTCELCQAQSHRPGTTRAKPAASKPSIKDKTSAVPTQKPAERFSFAQNFIPLSSSSHKRPASEPVQPPKGNDNNI